MADNTVLPAGDQLGDTIATDDVGGVKHQLVKLEFGPPDLQPVVVEDTAGKRFPVSVGDSALPAGAATQATLALIKAQTDNLDVLLSSRTKPADTQPISAVSLPLPSGAAADATLGVIDPVLSPFTVLERLKQIAAKLDISNKALAALQPPARVVKSAATLLHRS